MIPAWRAPCGRAVLLACLLVLAARPVLASPLDEGIAAVEAGDYARAAALFLPLAEAGDAEAQYNLGVLYRGGHGVEKDLARARDWFLRAAGQGLAEAQYQLGYMYDTGEGGEQSDRYAFLWYRKAAEQGNARAQTNLGVMYANGTGVAQDLRLAYVWFNLAAAQGQAPAFRNRQILAREFSAEELARLREQSRDYFQKYVQPFQTNAAGMMRGGSPAH